MVQRELAGIELSFEGTERASLKDMFRKDDQDRLFYRFLLCMGLNFFQQVRPPLPLFLIPSVSTNFIGLRRQPHLGLQLHHLPKLPQHDPHDRQNPRRVRADVEVHLLLHTLLDD